jgi:single-strand DNA-binding protein
MFGDVNKVALLGNITRDIELRQTSNGTSVCSFSIATNRNYQVNNEWKKETEFHNVVLWGRQAQLLSERAHKGTRIYIEGRLTTRSWEDQNGVKKFRTEVVALQVILLDRYIKPEGEFKEQGKEVDSKKPDSKPQATTPKVKKGKVRDEDSIDPDDLPF